MCYISSLRFSAHGNHRVGFLICYNNLVLCTEGRAGWALLACSMLPRSLAVALVSGPGRGTGRSPSLSPLSWLLWWQDAGGRGWARPPAPAGPRPPPGVAARARLMPGAPRQLSRCALCYFIIYLGFLSLGGQFW